jgi:hypothetical protein
MMTGGRGRKQDRIRGALNRVVDGSCNLNVPDSALRSRRRPPGVHAVIDYIWCRRWGSNPHEVLPSPVFETGASAYSATSAWGCVPSLGCARCCHKQSICLTLTATELQAMPHKSCYRKQARHDDASDGSRVRRRPATPLSAAQRREKAKIFDEFCQTTGLHRKAAVRLLNETSYPKLDQRWWSFYGRFGR